MDLCTINLDDVGTVSQVKPYTKTLSSIWRCGYDSYYIRNS